MNQFAFLLDPKTLGSNIVKPIELEFGINNDWTDGGGFTGYIKLTNNGLFLDRWVIEFEADFIINKIWGAKTISHIKNHYVIESKKSLAAGETITFGFNALVENQTITEPSNYLFNQQELTIFSQIGEVGKITNLNNLSQTIQLKNQYVNPVVFALPLSRNGGDPAIARITDIQSNNFSLYVQEPEYKDGFHGQETLSYLVLEAGTWQLNDGTILQVDLINTNATTSSGWETINFDANFSSTPMVLSQVQTDNDATFVRTRQQQSNIDSFQLVMEEEEHLRESGHGTETIGWLALETGAGTWNGMNYQAGITKEEVTHKSYSVNLSNFVEAPNVLAGLGTYNGLDSAGLRYTELNSTAVSLRVEEDTSADQEIYHAKEAVNFLAIEGAGTLTAIPYPNKDISFPPIDLSPQAIAVGFEDHEVGTKYNRSVQSQDWNVDWINTKRMDNYAIITDSEAHSGEKALRINHPTDASAGGSAAWMLPEEKEYYLSYWVKFDNDFDFDGPKRSGGKLPGLASEGGECSGGKICTGDNGFSSRYMWGKNGRARLYLYHMNKPTRWGESFWFQDINGNDKYFQPGQWHNLIQRVQINDGNQSNGEIDIWMDKELVVSLDGLQFVTNNRGIDTLMFSTFHGGNSSDWWPDRDVYSYWDDFIASPNASDVGF